MQDTGHDTRHMMITRPQTMDTAPRDGTSILLFRFGRWHIGRWDPDTHANRPAPFWTSYDGTGKRDLRTVEPTAWLPLPPPPMFDIPKTIRLVEEDGFLCIQNADLCQDLRAGDYDRGENRCLNYWTGPAGEQHPVACNWPTSDRATIESALRQERDTGNIREDLDTAVLPDGSEIPF